MQLCISGLSGMLKRDWGTFLQEMWRISVVELRSYGKSSEDFEASDTMRTRWNRSSLTLCRYKSLVCTREELGSLFVELRNGESHSDEGWKCVTCGSREMAPVLLRQLQL